MAKCRLLALSAEVRNRIYEYVLQDDTYVMIHDYAAVLAELPGLLRTCRQIRSEATAMYYNMNSFVYFDRNSLAQWLKAMSDEKRGIVCRLQHFAVTDWYDMDDAETRAHRDRVLARMQQDKALQQALVRWHFQRDKERALERLQRDWDHLALHDLEIPPKCLRTWLGDDQRVTRAWSLDELRADAAAGF